MRWKLHFQAVTRAHLPLRGLPAPLAVFEDLDAAVLRSQPRLQVCWTGARVHVVVGVLRWMDMDGCGWLWIYFLYPKLVITQWENIGSCNRQRGNLYSRGIGG